MEILEWFDETGEEMIHRLPPDGSLDIKFGAQLIVRESQQAFFFNGGQVQDAFQPGRHTLSSKNLPILTTALSLPWGFKSPFRCEVYFANRKTFTNLKWGTREPVVFKDARLGHVRLRAYGQTSFRIDDAVPFIQKMVGTRGSFFTHDATDYLRDVIVSRLNDYLGENLTSLFDLPAIYDEMGADLNLKLKDDFGKYGLALEDFFITAITPPEEIQAMVDSQGGMSLVHDMPGYVQYQMARAISSGKSGPAGGPSNDLVDTGVGLGLGMMMPAMMSRNLETDASTVQCSHCHQQVPAAPFCSGCGKTMQPAGSSAASQIECSGCGGRIRSDASFCSHCGTPVNDSPGSGDSSSGSEEA